jgi:hypothetical protein
MVSYRRCEADDDEPIFMAAFLKEISSEEGYLKLKTYRTPYRDDVNHTAASIALGGRAIITAPKWMLDEAEKGVGLHNHLLGHEFAHIALGHHDFAGQTKNFRMTERSGVNQAIAPDNEELEAHFGSVFFLCGVKLLNEEIEVEQLAKWSNSDLAWAKRARRIVLLHEFRRQLYEMEAAKQRVVL